MKAYLLIYPLCWALIPWANPAFPESAGRKMRTMGWLCFELKVTW